jgi:hypothetical protein
VTKSRVGEGTLAPARAAFRRWERVRGEDASVEVVYKRTELEQAWARSSGTTYILWPAGTSLPVDPLGGFF